MYTHVHTQYVRTRVHSRYMYMILCIHTFTQKSTTTKRPTAQQQYTHTHTCAGSISYTLTQETCKRASTYNIYIIHARKSRRHSEIPF